MIAVRNLQEIYREIVAKVPPSVIYVRFRVRHTGTLEEFAVYKAQVNEDLLWFRSIRLDSETDCSLTGAFLQYALLSSIEEIIAMSKLLHSDFVKLITSNKTSK
jgi:hypothetical protein